MRESDACVRERARERESGRAGERETRGRGFAPLRIPEHSAPPLGAPGLPPARWRRRPAPATGRRRGGHRPLTEHRRGPCPPPARKPGGFAPLQTEREGVCPPLRPRTGAQEGPWLPAAAGRRRRRPRRGWLRPPQRGRGKGFWDSRFLLVVVELTSLVD